MKLGQRGNDMKFASFIVTTVLLGTVLVLGGLNEVLAHVARVTLASAILGGTVLLCLALIAATLLRRGAASVRHRVWGMTIVALLVVPPLSLVLPQWRVPIIPAAVIEVPGSAMWLEGERGTSAPRPVGIS